MGAVMNKLDGFLIYVINYVNIIDLCSPAERQADHHRLLFLLRLYITVDKLVELHRMC